MARDFIPAARFEVLTPVYDLLCRWVGLGEALRRFELEALSQFHPRTLVEVGCGTGELLVDAGFRPRRVGTFRGVVAAWVASPASWDPATPS